MPGKVDVFTKKSARKLKKNSHLAILQFQTSESTPELGLKASKIFDEKISKKHFFKTITIIEDTSWFKREERFKINKAVLQARSLNADLLLFGAIEDYMPADNIETKVTLAVKLINVASGELLWWGRKKTVGKPGNTFLFFAKFLSPSPPDVEKLLNKAAQNIIDDIFQEVHKEKKPGFLSRVLNKLRTSKPPPHIMSAEEMESKKHYNELEPAEEEWTKEPEPVRSIPTDNLTGEQEPVQSVPIDNMTMKDILDKALEDLDSVDNDNMTLR